MNRSWIFPVLLVFLFLAGCSSKEGGESGVAEPAAQPFQQATGPEVHTISAGGMVTVNNTEFKIAEWGFAPIWGYEEPRGGAKYLWVHLISKNVGGVPQFTPYDFQISYRGTNASYILMGARHESKPYLDCRFCSTNPSSLCDVCEFYPDTANDGYILFEVPEGLESGEATFVANLYGEMYETVLTNPVPYEGLHISFMNASFSKPRLGMIPGGWGKNSYELKITLINDRHAPVKEFDNFILQNFSINGEQVSLYPYATTSTRSLGEGIAPFEEKTLDSGLVLEYDKDDQVYKRGAKVVGAPGETAIIEFEVKRPDGQIQPGSVQAEIPFPEE